MSVGEDLEGAEGIEYTPDVYGKLETLHGTFESAINFVCDNPPSIYRVRALLETIESYTTRKQRSLAETFSCPQLLSRLAKLCQHRLPGKASRSATRS